MIPTPLRPEEHLLLAAPCPVCLDRGGRVRMALDFLPEFPPGMNLVRCGACGTERVDPHPSPERMARHYDRAYFQEGYLPYLERRRGDFAARLAELEAFAPVRRARQEGRAPTCFDIGAGVGLFCAEARARGYAITGIEPSAEARTLARDVLGIELYEDWPLTPPVADLITLWDVLGHVESPRGLLLAARARLDPGGGLVVKLPNFRSAWHRTRASMSRRRRANLIHVPTVLWRLDRRGAAALLSACGFRVEAVVTVTEPDLLPLTPRWRAVRLATGCLDALLGNRDEMVILARAR